MTARQCQLGPARNPPSRRGQCKPSFSRGPHPSSPEARPSDAAPTLLAREQSGHHAFSAATGVMQTPESAGTHDCFAHPDVTELTSELATIRSRPSELSGREGRDRFRPRARATGSAADAPIRRLARGAA